MKEILKRCAGALLGEYSAYYIYSMVPDAGGHAPAAASTDPYTVRLIDRPGTLLETEPVLAAESWYAGTEACSYACVHDDRIVGLCFYWFGDRYRKRNFWPLAEGEAKLVQIITAPSMRGRGVATALIAGSARDMIERGFSGLYARIWHSNAPSYRAFERAGWGRVCLVVDVDPLRLQRPLRLRIRRRRHPTQRSPTAVS